MLSSTIVWTLLLEGGLLLVLFRFEHWLFGTCVVLNLLTQFGLIFALQALYPYYWLPLLVGEVLIVLVEAGGYALAKRRARLVWRRGGTALPLTFCHALLLSLGLNGFSFVVGLFLPFAVLR